MIDDFFQNKFQKIDSDVYVLEKEDDYTTNFGKQWRDYRDVQIDSINKYKISYEYLNDIFFNDLNILKEKEVLEIGCGAGRFTEYIIKYCKSCFSLDLSQAIYFNVAKGDNKLKLIKCNYINLKPKKKFDIVLCRGVLQHTPNPEIYLLKLFEFIDKNGTVVFDIYKKPKLFFLNFKYILWRPLIQKLVSYEDFEYFLKKHISKLLKIKRILKKMFILDIISDNIIPIWDYKNKLKMSDKELEKWAILDTLDGIYAKYDFPLSFNKIIKILNKNNIKVLKSNKKRNFFLCQKF